MTLIASARQQWLASPRRDLLAGTVVALALIPEAIAFSIIAGVDPAVGLYASVVIAVTISLVGGRPAMISAATGAMALLMVTLVRDHGLDATAHGEPETVLATLQQLFGQLVTLGLDADQVAQTCTQLLRRVTPA